MGVWLTLKFTLYIVGIKVATPFYLESDGQ